MSDSEEGASGISDEEVFRRKLLMDGEGKGDSTKIDELLSTFLHWCDGNDQTDEEITEGYDNLLTQLDSLKLSFERSVEAQRANARQIEEYDKVYADLEKEVVDLNRVIAQNHLDLEEAKKVKVHKMKYNALGRIILSLPDRKESMKRLKKVEQDIKFLKLQKRFFLRRSDEREKHLSLLLTAAHELKDKLQKELEDEEGSESD